jgi:O-antigen/teichoic acid export membrane protein
MRKLLRRAASLDRALEGAVLIAQLIGAVTGVLLARALGPVGRGEVATLALWGQLIGWIASFSLDKGVIVLTKKEHVALRRRVALVTSRRLVAVFSLPAMAIAVLLGRFLFTGWYLPIMLGVLAITIAQMELVGGWLLALGERPLYLLWRLAQPTIYLVAVGGTALLRLRGSVTTHEAILLIVAGVVISVVGPVLLRFLPYLSPEGGWFSWGAARHLLRYGLAAQTANILTYLNGQLDLLALTLVAGSGVVGSYAVGASVAQVVVLFGSAAIVRGLTGESEGRDRLAGIASVVIALAVIVGAPTFVPLVFGTAFHSAVYVAQILAAGNVFNFFLLSACGRLLGSNRPWHATIAQASGVIVFGGILLPFHSLRDVALASDISYLVSLIVAEILLLNVSATRGRHVSVQG